MFTTVNPLNQSKAKLFLRSKLRSTAEVEVVYLYTRGPCQWISYMPYVDFGENVTCGFSRFSKCRLIIIVVVIIITILEITLFRNRETPGDGRWRPTGGNVIYIYMYIYVLQRCAVWGCVFGQDCSLQHSRILYKYIYCTLIETTLRRHLEMST